MMRAGAAIFISVGTMVIIWSLIRQLDIGSPGVGTETIARGDRDRGETGGLPDYGVTLKRGAAAHDDSHANRTDSRSALSGDFKSMGEDAAVAADRPSTTASKLDYEPASKNTEHQGRLAPRSAPREGTREIDFGFVRAGHSKRKFLTVHSTVRRQSRASVFTRGAFRVLPNPVLPGSEFHAEQRAIQSVSIQFEPDRAGRFRETLSLTNNAENIVTVVGHSSASAPGAGVVARRTGAAPTRGESPAAPSSSEAGAVSPPEAGTHVPLEGTSVSQAPATDSADRNPLDGAREHIIDRQTDEEEASSAPPGTVGLERRVLMLVNFNDIGEIEVEVVIDADRGTDIRALGLAEILPSGWEFLRLGSGQVPDFTITESLTKPRFAWLAAESFPLRFTYFAAAPETPSITASIHGSVVYRGDGSERRGQDVQTPILPGATPR